MPLNKDLVRRFLRTAENLQLRNLAMQSILIQHRIPRWKEMVDHFASDPELVGGVHAQFRPFYALLDAQDDPAEALQEFLRAFPTKGRIQ